MPIELILKTKIEGLGAEADIVTVKPGYARNFLIPKNYAAPATLATKRQVEELKRKRAEREANELNEAQELAGKLGKLKLAFTMVSGQGQEKVFGSITSQDIAAKIKEAGYDIDKKKNYQLPKPIKDRGEHEVILALGHGVEATLKIDIVSAPAREKEETEDAARPGKKSKTKRHEKPEKV